MLTVFVVTDLKDDTLANLAGDGELSLREAIEAANTDSSVDGSAAGSGADEIVFADTAWGIITLTGSRLNISDDLTITGPGIAPEFTGVDNVSVYIHGNYNYQIFNIDALANVF